MPQRRERVASYLLLPAKAGGLEIKVEVHPQVVTCCTTIWRSTTGKSTVKRDKRPLNKEIPPKKVPKTQSDQLASLSRPVLLYHPAPPSATQRNLRDIVCFTRPRPVHKRQNVAYKTYHSAQNHQHPQSPSSLQSVHSANYRNCLQQESFAVDKQDLVISTATTYNNSTNNTILVKLGSPPPRNVSPVQANQVLLACRA